MRDVAYSAESELRFVGPFLAGIWTDMSAAPPVAWQLFTHRLRANYRQSWLGYLWLLLPPVATAGAWLLLGAARILDVRGTTIPYPVYVLSGILLWQLFAEALASPLQQLLSSRAILTKSRMPHEALLLAGLAEVLFNFVVRLAVLLPVLVWFATPWRPTMLLAIPGVVALMLFGFAIGLLVTPVGLLYHDVARGVTLATGIWFVLTPVIYPPSAIGIAATVGALNPVTAMLVTTRRWLTGEAITPAHGFGAMVVVTLLTLVVAWIGYRIARPHLVARL